jgi:hypothetical protein
MNDEILPPRKFKGLRIQQSTSEMAKMVAEFKERPEYNEFKEASLTNLEGKRDISLDKTSK